MDFSDKDTDWNFALAYLKRIDGLLQRCNYFKTIRDYDNWLLSIDAVHTEMHPRFETRKNSDGSTYDESKEADKLRIIAKNQVNSFVNKSNIDRWIIHDSLNNYERYIRNIIRLRGMDMPKKTDAGHSLLDQKN